MTHPSDVPEPSPFLARTPPPLPPAPPTVEEGGESGDGGGGRGGLVLSSGQQGFLAIIMIAVGLAAWLISVPAVVCGLVASSPAVFFAARFRFIAFH